jgi:hypothetical protein
MNRSIGSKWSAVVFFFLVLCIAGCHTLSDPGHKFGTGTVIPEGKAAIDVVRQIQDEFRAIPKPILKTVVHHKSWKVSRLAAGSVTYGPFFEVRLTKTVYAFCEKHTSREILVSLTPLLFDDDLGGEVAVFLSGLPTKNAGRGFLTSHG